MALHTVCFTATAASGPLLAALLETIVCHRHGKDQSQAQESCCTQAQPTAAEVKGEVIQPIADKVKEEVRLFLHFESAHKVTQPIADKVKAEMCFH